MESPGWWCLPDHVGNAGDAEDLVQECLFKVARR
jgi:DNA-directed RNA polymerase specialized sigma24 family protein